jgi:maleylpyruvate isomerase
MRDDSSPAQIGQRIDAATSRLIATAASLTDEQVRQPSPLPGWSRGHVLTHIARNADGLRNLLTWARTGVRTPQYASQQARDAEIEAGAGRVAAAQLADLAESAAVFAAERDQLADGDWDTMVQGLNGPPHPAWFTLRRRLSEVEIHHVDLDAGYHPANWPADFVAYSLPRVAGGFAGEQDCPAVRLREAGAGTEYLIGPAGQDPGLTVTGPGHGLLGWLIGRSSGAGLTTDPAGPLPRLPAW